VGVAFLPLTDSSGTTQVVTQNEDHRSLIKDLPPESVVLIKGKVCDRPTKDINESMVTGGIEVLADEVEVLNSARESLPFFSFSKSSQNVSDEELKLRERYLEIRRGPLQHNLRLRSKVSSIIRDFLINQNFVEVETPTLFKSTPEGANEFIVPTRRRGQFYSLVQSPQQFKQLLMVGGIDRYYQIARCYRDEDQRADRQPEFTQV
jgi:aspartyl-tRNA synthetase